MHAINISKYTPKIKEEIRNILIKYVKYIHRGNKHLFKITNIYLYIILGEQ